MFEEYEEGFDPSKETNPYREYASPVVFEDETPIPGISNFTDLYSSDDILRIVNDSDFAAFADLYPNEADVLRTLGSLDQSRPDVIDEFNVTGGPGTQISEGDIIDEYNVTGGPGTQIPKGTTPTTLKSLIDSLKQGIQDLTGFKANDVFKTAIMAALARLAYNDAKEAREMQRGYIAKAGDIPRTQAVRGSDGGVGFRAAAEGGLMSMVDTVDPTSTMQRILTDPEHQQKFEGYLMDELQQRGYTGGGMQGYAEGGVARYFAGGTDGMADQIPAQIEGQRPAALSDGEFVIPADVVSHLGNGNSTAGAKRLYEMMDRIRNARTGTTQQGKQINPNAFIPR